jgi:hypothetical protein
MKSDPKETVIHCHSTATMISFGDPSSIALSLLHSIHSHPSRYMYGSIVPLPGARLLNELEIMIRKTSRNARRLSEFLELLPMVVPLASVDCFLNGHETNVNWRRDFCCPKLAMRKCQWLICSSAAVGRDSLLLIHGNIPYFLSNSNYSIHVFIPCFPVYCSSLFFHLFTSGFAGMSDSSDHFHSLRSISIFGRISKLDVSYTPRQQNVFHAKTLIRRNPTIANDSNRSGKMNRCQATPIKCLVIMLRQL